MEEETNKEKIRKEMYLDNKEKGLLDAFQEKLVSRKLFVFLVSTGLMLGDKLNSDTWAIIAGVYVFGLIVLDSIGKWKGLL